uniref:Uncharacterized protein n=1 Tax=Arundo donax TaxID=35708 RepID=A0A0A8YML0_ARUDO
MRNFPFTYKFECITKRRIIRWNASPTGIKTSWLQKWREQVRTPTGPKPSYQASAKIVADQYEFL